MKEHENLKALVYGHDLNDYQRKLAQNEFESLLHPPQTDLLRKAKDLIHVQFISTPLGNAESWEVFIKIEPTLIEIEQALKTKQTDDREDSKTVVLKEARELIQNYVDSGLTNVDIKNMLYRIDLALSEQALNKKG